MDENFWLAICFVVFLYIAFKPIKKALLKSLDQYVNEIKAQIAESTKLKTEALSLLKEAEKKISDFENRREVIITNADNVTNSLLATKQSEMESMIKRRERASIDAMQRYKIETMQKLKNEYLNPAIEVAKQYLIQSKTEPLSNEEIIEKFLKEKS